MTEAVQQWMADEATKYSEHSHDAQDKFISGLTKGIEIAEGFAEWRDNMIATEQHYYFMAGIKYKFTTSQLLETYLSHLLNKEKL